MQNIIKMLKKINITYLIYALLGYFITVGTLYALAPTMLARFETSVLMQSLVFSVNGDVYTDINAANRSTILYGQWLFMVFGFVLKGIPPLWVIKAVKCLGVVLFLSSLWLLNKGFKKQLSPNVANSCFLVTMLLYAGYRHLSFIPKGEPFILFGLSLFVYALSLTSLVWMVLLASFGLALTWGVKVHACIYAAPLLIILIKKKGWALTSLVVALSVLIGFLPFLSNALSLQNYVQFLMTINGQDKLLKTFLINNFYGAGLFLSLIIASRLARNKAYKLMSLDLFLIAGSLIVVSIVGSKIGSGRNHYLPFIPVFVFYIGLLKPNFADVFKAKINVKLMVFFVCVVMLFQVKNALVSQLHLVSWLGYKHVMSIDRAIEKDIIHIKNENKGLSIMMGWGPGSQYNEKAYYLRPLLFDTYPQNFLDAIALADYVRAHVDIPETTMAKIRTKPVDIILIPNEGEPFFKEGALEPLFTKAFKSVFVSHYYPATKTHYFTVWKKIVSPNV